MKIALVPGDARQKILGELLAARGHLVEPYLPDTRADAWLFPLPTGAHPALKDLPEGSLALTGMVQITNKACFLVLKYLSAF